MIVKMGCNNVGCGIIRWMLYRTELIYFPASRHNNNASRMLSGGSLNSCTSFGQSCTLCLADLNISLFEIFLHITKGCFIRNGTNSTCLECVTLSKDSLCIFVGFGLVFP